MLVYLLLRIKSNSEFKVRTVTRWSAASEPDLFEIVIDGIENSLAKIATREYQCLNFVTAILDSVVKPADGFQSVIQQGLPYFLQNAISFSWKRNAFRLNLVTDHCVARTTLASARWWSLLVMIGTATWKCTRWIDVEFRPLLRAASLLLRFQDCSWIEVWNISNAPDPCVRLILITLSSHWKSIIPLVKERMVYKQ